MSACAIIGDAKMFPRAEAIRMMVMLIAPHFVTTVVSISGVIGRTVVRKACTVGMDYWHNSNMGISNKFTYADIVF